MNLVAMGRNDLLAPLQAVLGAVEQRHTLPILSNALLELGGHALAITASDASLEISVTVPARYSGEVRTLTAPLRKLVAILRELPADAPVALELRSTRLRISSKDATFNLQTLPATDFPRMNAPTDVAAEITLPTGELKRLLTLTSFAMASQDIRQFLNGALVCLRDGTLAVVATDTIRLASASYAVNDAATRFSVILPRRAIIELGKLLPGTDDPVTVRVLQNQAEFRFGGVTLVTALLEGTFPSYGRVIPSNCERRLRVDRQRLLRALQRVGVLVGKLGGVRWSVTDARLTLAAANDQTEDAVETLAVHCTGGDIDFGYNIRYHLDALAAVESPQVECAIGPGGVMLITLADRPDYRYCVMPMRM